MRVRLGFSKQGAQSFTSTLDLQKIWERTIRRADLKVKYSQGFHPQPRIQIANPLAVGFSGDAELVDVWLDDEPEMETIQASLELQMPAGLALKSVSKLLDEGRSLPAQVRFSDYRITFYENMNIFPELSSTIQCHLERSSIPRERNKKSYDLRPLIQSMEAIILDSGQPEIHMRLCTNPAQTGRPDEVMEELGFQLTDYRVTRAAIILAD